MNTIRTIESATLLSIAGLCAAAAFSIVFQSTAVAAPVKATAGAMSQTTVMRLAPVVIVGKRLTAAEKAATHL
jgi:hypothetical protein